MQKIAKKEKGITLIALIITIIVLLILAGISIATLTGENGVLTKAKTAKEEMKRAEYAEELKIIGLGLQPDRVTKNWDNQKYMNEYEDGIRKDMMFHEAKEIRQVPNTEEITIEVITVEGWVYWITENKVEFKGVEGEIQYPEIEETDIYAGLNGTTLSFFNNKEEAEQFADSEEHTYRNIRGEVYTRGWQKPPNTPWINDAGKIQIINFATEIVPINMACYFSDLTALTTIENIQNLKTERVSSMYALFYNCTSLESIDLSKLDTRNVETMDAMFYNCSSLKAIDVSTLNTSKVTNMNSMFSACTNLTTIDLSKFDTSNVITMEFMFSSSTKLQNIIFPEKMNTSKVTSIRELIADCTSLTTIDLSKLDTSSVQNMQGVFFNCINLTTLDLSNFDTRNVTNMSDIFSQCEKLESVNLSSFDTSKVTTMYAMFYHCYNLTELDLSSFDTNQVNYMTIMFESCGKLTQIYVGNRWKTASKSEGMFSGCGTSTTTLKN